MNENVVGVLRTLGLGDSADVAFVDDASPGRVSIVHGTTADVIWSDESGAEQASTSQFATNLNLSPVAGDWVSVRDGYVVAVSPRTTELRRPGATPGDVQVLAANIDVVLVVLPIDRELNVLMLERLAVMAFDSGAVPIVVLTKSDGSDVVESIVRRGTRDRPRRRGDDDEFRERTRHRRAARDPSRGRDGGDVGRLGRRQDVAPQRARGHERVDHRGESKRRRSPRHHDATAVSTLERWRAVGHPRHSSARSHDRSTGARRRLRRRHGAGGAVPVH